MGVGVDVDVDVGEVEGVCVDMGVCGWSTV